jgi:hypothetical protein
MPVGSSASRTPRIGPERASAPSCAARARVTIASIVLSLVCAPTADAATWRLSGPDRPRAGESSTYILHGTAGLQYRVHVRAGGRSCTGHRPPVDAAQTRDFDGYIDADSTASEQISVAPGQSTICIYDYPPVTLLASKVVDPIPGRDRLRITATRQSDNFKDVAIVAVTGYVGRKPVPHDAGLTAREQHDGKVLVRAIPSDRDCPRSPPREFAPHTGSADVSTARFRNEITLDNAFAISTKLRLCAYLTAERHIRGSIRTRTVASANAKLSADPEPAPAYPDDGTEYGAIFGGILAWIFVGSLVIAGIRFFLPDRAPASATGPGGPPPPGHGMDVSQRVAGPSLPDSSQRPTRPPVPRTEPVVPEQSERLRAEPSFVVQAAGHAVQKVYGERLQTFLEHQDGAEWLAKLNQRRIESLAKRGKPAPEPYESLESRAVLTSLGHDPVGKQLISDPAAKSARQLLTLFNKAVHYDPQAPPTEGDGYRAWQLYTDITGRVTDGDPFER